MPSYIAIIHKEPESDYGVSFPDFPGCITAGVTLDEAKDMAVEALTGHIRCLLEDGEEIPAPSPLETIMATPDFADGVAFLVSVLAGLVLLPIGKYLDPIWPRAASSPT